MRQPLLMWWTSERLVFQTWIAWMKIQFAIFTFLEGFFPPIKYLLHFFNLVSWLLLEIFFGGVPWWFSRLRIQRCQCCGSSCCYCGAGLTPGPGTSTHMLQTQAKKKKKKKKKEKKKKRNLFGNLLFFLNTFTSETFFDTNKFWFY